MWFIEARPGVIAWRARGSTGGALPGAGTGQRTAWHGVVSGKPQVFTWPKANGTGGSVAVGGRPWQWRGFNRRMSVYAWRAPTITNPVPTPPPPPPPSGGGADYGDTKKRKRYVYESNGRLVVTTDAGLAMRSGSASEVPEEVEAVAVVPTSVEVKEVKQLADKYQKQEAVETAVKQADFGSLYALYQEMWIRQDEEDVEMLLLAL